MMETETYCKYCGKPESHHAVDCITNQENI